MRHTSYTLSFEIDAMELGEKDNNFTEKTSEGTSVHSTVTK